MSTVTTWCLKPKDKAELILFLRSQGEMRGTLSHPTARATAASAVQNMQRAVGVPWALAVPSALVPLQSRSVRPARRHTCRSTASSGRPTSTAFKAEVSSETRDGEKKKCPSVSRQRTDALKHVTTSNAESRHSSPLHVYRVTTKMCV